VKHFCVTPADEMPTLRDTYEHWFPRTADYGEDPQRYPRSGRDHVRLVLLASIAAILIGVPVWIEANTDGERNAARAARERRGRAVVTDVWVEKDDSGEGEPEFTTFVDALLRLDDRRLVDIELHRPDDVSSGYTEEQSISVVYDAAVPRDADFADGPTRHAQADSVSMRKQNGPLLLCLGLLGAGLAGTAMGRDWRRRLR
jgi:hypothetical protein